MAQKRTLPERRNPLIEPTNCPSYGILVERRRLGQTNLILKTGQMGLTNASKPDHPGYFDYAHLRVPLPKDLSGSGIFTLGKTTSYPESYFLMRRSSDGYISATGMFKAAFPWASHAEADVEARHHKSLASAGTEEVAGSIWIAPEEALELGDEYGMRIWITALLDPEPIEKGTKDKHNQNISTPPRFDTSRVVAPPVTLPPSSALRATRSRSSRSVSPSKIATPSRKMATPRKSRSTRSAARIEAAASEEPSFPERVEAPSKREKSTENGVFTEESVASESVNAESVNGESVRIEVQETVEQNGDVETTTTNVKVDLPADAPEIPLPENPEDMIAKAKEMVEEANRLEGRASGSRSSKRKAEELEVEEDDGESVKQPAKKVKVLEQQVKKERVTTKALIGLGAVAALGTAIQYFF